MSQLARFIENLPKPTVLSAGHTMGVYHKPNAKYYPIVPPYISGQLSEAARLLGVGNTALISLDKALRLRSELSDTRLCFLLNDTSNIRKKLEDNDVSVMRRQLSSTFAGSIGLPRAYIKLLKFYEVALSEVLRPYRQKFELQHSAALFWTESELRNRFSRTVKQNTDFFEGKISLTPGSVSIFRFHGMGDLDYCKLSAAPDSITGGPDCVAEIIQLCLELFGCVPETLRKVPLAIKNFAFKSKLMSSSPGTLVIFYPNLCHDHVVSGLNFYREHFTNQHFEWVSIPYSMGKGDGIRINNIECSVHKI